MKYRKGFTIVEVAVTVAIIAILATFITMTLTGQQVKARDSARASKVSIISDALERYYDTHGEYPSVRALLNTYSDNTGSAVATRLSINEQSTLVMPSASSGTTNSIASSITSDDTIAYVASSTVGNDNCQTSLQGGCEQYTLSYKKESDGSTVTVESQKKIPTTATDNPLGAPTKPTITAAQSGLNIIATSSTPACSTSQNMTPRYAFKSQVGSGSWSSWSAWQTSRNYTLGSNTNGTTYSFQVRVHCESSAATGDTSQDSDSVSITYYTTPATPTTPTITAALSGSNVVATASTVTCDIGTGQYQIDRRTNDGSWTTGSWGGANSYSVTATDGVKYGFRVTVQCTNGTQTSTSTTSTEATYIDPITAPGAPTMSGTGPTWSWAAASCPTGTSASYHYRFTYNSTSGFTGSWTQGSWVATTSTSATNSAATSQGLKYSIDIQQRCYNANATSAWGTQASGATLIVPVTHVQTVYYAGRLNSLSYGQVLVKSFSGTCASGTTREVAIKADWDNEGTWATVTSWQTGTEGTIITLSSRTVASGTQLEVGVWTRCRNTSTSYATDSSGNTQVSDLYDIGNIYNRGSSKYNVGCWAVSGKSSYCAGGYDSGGTKNTTTSSVLACNVRSAGISDTSTRYTALVSFGTTNPCWDA